MALNGPVSGGIAHHAAGILLRLVTRAMVRPGLPGRERDPGPRKMRILRKVPVPWELFVGAMAIISIDVG